ncbi:MAG: ABC transporter substrate-binding protein [Treponema sp.]|nr:ABC transporter substrate-binding protein [Treponema sp.]
MNCGFRRIFNISTFISAAAVVFLIGGCGRGPASGNTPVPDSAAITGNTAVTGSAAVYNRIISAAPSNTEIVTGLGLGDRIIATDKYSEGIAGIPQGIPLIDFFYPDTEAIAGLNPDLILVNEINSYGAADNPFRLLGNLGIKVIQIPTSTSIGGICDDILFIANTLGVPDRGEKLTASINEKIAQIKAAGEKLAAKKSVYFEVSAAPSMVTFGQGAYLNEMIEIAGGINIFADQKGWFSPGPEEIINRNPDIIFTMLYPGEDPVAEIKSRTAFTGITAVKENQVYAINADSASRPSQNILPALRQMAGIINPLYYETPR